MVWSALLGAISLELFGQFHNVVGEDPLTAMRSSPSAWTAGPAQLGIA